MYRKLRLVLLLLSAASLAGGAFAQDTGSATQFSGTWNGYWNCPEGFIYLAEMRLGSAGDGSVEGQINWVLKKSPRAEEQSQIGLTGIEFVKGTYDPANRVLAVDGYNKTDPNNILGLDKYRLILAENGTVLGGITWNHGSWRGLIGLSRKEN